MKELLNSIEQNDFLDKVVVEIVDDTLLNNIIIQKTKSFKTYNSESERDATP